MEERTQPFNVLRTFFIQVAVLDTSWSHVVRYFPQETFKLFE